MDRWKSRGKKSQRRERKKKIREEKESEERSSRCEKRWKSRETVFFSMLVTPEGRKVGSLKRRVRSHLVRWEIKNCTPLWHKANLEVKKQKSLTSGALLEVEIEKMHAAVARSPFRSPNVQTATTTLQLQLQLQLHYTTLHPAVVVEVTTATTPKAQLQPPFGPSVDGPDIHASSQLTSPIVSYLWNFRHRLVRYYW